jgi:hypothetical protein
MALLRVLLPTAFSLKALLRFLFLGTLARCRISFEYMVHW